MNMPYIKQEDRVKWMQTIEDIASALNDLDEDKQDGEFNFVISSILQRVYHSSYHKYNRAIGVLECVKAEFYRKQVVPYEKHKEIENGGLR